MANTDSKIVNSWSLLSFAREFGTKMAVGPCVNHESGEVYQACCFTNKEGLRTFVGFSRNLGKLSSSEIVARKADLQIVKLESGNYKLCKVGQSDWKDVDLGL